jgi:alpha-tubulin suppressor-like RCC1 family protein
VEDTTFEPVRVPFEEVISDLALGDDFTCGLTQEGRIFCFGENGLGQTGTGSTDAIVTVPTRVENLARALVIDAGNDHACAIVDGNSLACWGSGTHGQLGQGGTDGFFDQPRPYPVPE